MAATLSAHDHAVIMYREMLVSLKKFNELEAQIERLVDDELTKLQRPGRRATEVDRVVASSRADAVATDQGIYGRLYYHRERIKMYALAYGVSVNYGQTFERRPHGGV